MDKPGLEAALAAFCRAPSDPALLDALVTAARRAATDVDTPRLLEAVVRLVALARRHHERLASLEGSMRAAEHMLDAALADTALQELLASPRRRTTHQKPRNPLRRPSGMRIPESR